MSSEGSHTDEDQSECKKDPQPDASRDGGDVQDALTAERIGSAVFNFYDTVSGSVGISGMGSPSPRRMTGVLNDAEIDDALRHFVQPAGWAAARADLVARHVVGLSGTPGSGRETTALALLREVTSGPVVVLSPVASLKELAERTYDRGRAYLVVDRISEPSAADGEFLWRQVERRIKAVDAFLAMTVGAGSAISSCGLPTTPLARPDLECVIQAHLADVDPPPDLRAVRAAVPDDWRMGTVARYLRRLQQHDDVAEAAAEFDTEALTTVSDWIQQTTDRRELLTVVAACFLSGCNERFLESRRSLLELRMDARYPEPEPADEGQAADPLVAGRTRRTARSGLLQIERGIERGRTRKGVTFRDPAYRRLVLRLLWDKGYEAPFWDAVAEWIDEIFPSCDPDEIATGLALLADADFDEVEHSYLDPWAAGRRGYAGQLQAAHAIWSLCYDTSDNEQLSREALRKAVEWSQSPDRKCRETGVIVLSGPVGLRYPTEATRKLWHLIVHGGSVRDIARIGLATLFASLVDHSTDSGSTIFALLDRQLRSFTGSADHELLVDCTMLTVLELLTVTMNQRRNLAVLEYLRRHPGRIDVVARTWAALIRHARYRRRAIEALWRALNNMPTVNTVDPQEDARALGIALRRALPVAEHARLKTDLTLVDRILRGPDSRALVGLIIEILGASDGVPAGREQ